MHNLNPEGPNMAKSRQTFVHVLAVPLRFPDKIVLHYHPANPSNTSLIGDGSYELRAETWASISQRLVMSSSYLNEKEGQLRSGNNVNLGFHFVGLPDTFPVAD